jgi:pimeloyl-ACP methyl ester carboxylesterase
MKKARFLASVALLLGAVPVFAGVNAGRPADWISHVVDFSDTRTPLPKHSSPDARLEVIELPAPANTPIKGVMLMIPGFFQNANSFDLLPEKGISVARYLSAKFGLKIYLLNIRGLGHASAGKKLALDDFPIDDIPAAIHWVATRENTKIFVFGHSQGGIMLQASLAGLDRCGLDANCFRGETAALRQSEVRAIALSGANVAMTTDNPDSQLTKIGALGKKLKGILSATVDRIHIRGLVRNPLLFEFAYLKPWEFLYHRANVSGEAELALYRRTIENSWMSVVAQYVHGINKQGLAAHNGDQPGERYADALANITVPLVAVTYGLDPMAEPGTTERDDFNRLGSATKHFYQNAVQGHEDFMMNSAMHADWDAPIAQLLSR